MERLSHLLAHGGNLIRNSASSLHDSFEAFLLFSNRKVANVPRERTLLLANDMGGDYPSISGSSFLVWIMLHASCIS
jgi:hypothetical protein